MIIVSTRRIIWNVCQAFVVWHVFAFSGSQSTHADDFVDVLKQCNQVVEDPAATLRLGLQRSEGVWHVVDLQLDTGSLTQVVDADIEDLSSIINLEELTFRGDQSRVTARGLNQLRALPHLKYLAIPWSLTADQLRAISAVPELEDLNLRTHQSRELDAAGLAYFSRLRRLKLANVGLDDAALSYLKNLKSLHDLDLKGNPRVSDAGLASLATLKTLRRLRLDNHMNISDTGISRLRALRELRSLENVGQLGSASIASLAELPQFEQLAIGKFSRESDQDSLSSLHNLKRLSISAVSGGTPCTLPPNLRQLSLSYDTVSSVSVPSAPRLQQLTVYFPRNRANDPHIHDLAWLLALSDLRCLTLVNVFGADLSIVTELEELRALRLRGSFSSLNDGGRWKGFANLKNLQILEIEGDVAIVSSQITRNVTNALRELTELRRLKLRGISLLDRDTLATVGELKQLRVLELDLSGVASLDHSLLELQRLSKLEELSIAALGLETLSNEGLLKLSALKQLRCLDLGDAQGYTQEGLAALVRDLPNLRVLRIRKPVAHRWAK